MSESKNKERYLAAAHAMQTGVAFMIGREPTENNARTEPA